jgi:hypothetical protein
MVALARTGGHRQRRCRRSLTTDSSGPSLSGGEAGGAQTAAVDDGLPTEVVSNAETSVARLW